MFATYANESLKLLFTHIFMFIFKLSQVFLQTIIREFTSVSNSLFIYAKWPLYIWTINQICLIETKLWTTDYGKEFLDIKSNYFIKFLVQWVLIVFLQICLYYNEDIVHFDDIEQVGKSQEFSLTRTRVFYLQVFSSMSANSFKNSALN